MDWEYIANKFSDKPDRMLFHYTDIKGLEGIIHHEEVWATDHCYLNDYSEFDHGIEAFNAAVASNKIKHNKLFNDKYNYDSDLVSVIKNIKRKEGIYCCSFSSKENLLGQWRGYCPKDGGYSIGFRSDALMNITESCYTNFFRCIYENRKQREIARQVIEESLLMFESPAGLSDCGNQTFHTHLKAAASFFSSAFKNKHFRAESEWRLVSRPLSKSEVRYRAKGNVLNAIPYIKFQVPNTAIEKIYIGPCNDPSGAEKALKEFVQSKGINPEIIVSDIPLR